MTVSYLIDLDRELYETYWLYQELLDSIHKRSEDDFIEVLNGKREHISDYMNTALKTTAKNKESIINSFKYNYTNGRIEGIINLIKVIKRIAFGYRNYKNFKTRILLICNNTMVKINT